MQTENTLLTAQSRATDSAMKTNNNKVTPVGEDFDDYDAQKAR